MNKDTKLIFEAYASKAPITEGNFQYEPNLCPKCGKDMGDGKGDPGANVQYGQGGVSSCPHCKAVLPGNEPEVDDAPTVTNSQACPGCGSMPGDGVNPNCNNPNGCGYWKKEHADTQTGNDVVDKVWEDISQFGASDMDDLLDRLAKSFEKFAAEMKGEPPHAHNMDEAGIARLLRQAHKLIQARTGE